MSSNRLKYYFLLQLVLVVGTELGRSIDHHGNTRGTVALERLAVKHLRLAPDSPFKITLFADLHFGENAWTDWGPKQDLNSLRAMSNVLDCETPDLVVYLGDVITANNIPTANASMYWDLATSPARERGLAWASVFGNHDDAQFVWPIEWFSASGIPPLNGSSPSSPSKAWDFTGTTRVELMNHEIESYQLSMSQFGPMTLQPSISNYVIQISSSGNAKSPVAFLYFLDSGGGSYPEVISSGQVEWFQSTSQEVNPCSRVPEVIFWHIPSRAYSEVAPSSSILKPCVGSINYDKVATQETEFGIMDVLDKSPSVKAVIVGHNHGLDWCCPRKKLWPCFARHSGYGGYGNWAKGARILQISEKPFSLKSWIRMEDGSVHSQIVLSS